MNKNKNNKFSLKWNILDVFIIIPMLIISIALSIFIYFIPSNTISDNDTSAKVVVFYNSVLVTSENLIPSADESDPRYIILFKNEQSIIYDSEYPNNKKFGNNTLLLADLIIEIKQKKVSIVQETSPNNICSKQGEISSPNVPLTCAPNYVIVLIKSTIASDVDITV